MLSWYIHLFMYIYFIRLNRCMMFCALSASNKKETERVRERKKNTGTTDSYIHSWYIYIQYLFGKCDLVLFCFVVFFFCLFEFDFDINMICYSLRYVDIKLPETEIHSNDKIYRSDSSICDIFSEVINLFQVFILELELEWSSKSCCSFFFSQNLAITLFK